MFSYFTGKGTPTELNIALGHPDAKLNKQYLAINGETLETIGIPCVSAYLHKNIPIR